MQFVLFNQFGLYTESKEEEQMGVGMPAALKLQEFGAHVAAVFGSEPYHVGSSVESKTGWRDVDVRMILTDEEWIAWGFGHPDYVEHRDPKWIALCLAFSALGRDMTGLPIDFQIQQQTRANKQHKGPRNALGFVPHRFVPDEQLDAPTWTQHLQEKNNQNDGGR